MPLNRRQFGTAILTAIFGARRIAKWFPPSSYRAPREFSEMLAEVVDRTISADYSGAMESVNWIAFTNDHLGIFKDIA